MGKGTEQSFRTEGAQVEQAAEAMVAMGAPRKMVRDSLEKAGFEAAKEEGLSEEAAQRVISEVLAVFDDHTGGNAEGASFDGDESDDDGISDLLSDLGLDDETDAQPRTLNRYL